MKDLSDLLKERYHNARSFSVRSIERFCVENGIRRKGCVPDEILDELVKGACLRLICIQLVNSHPT